MGYKHYWRRAPEMDRAGFSKAVEDIKTIMTKAIEMGIKMAGPTGKGKPELTEYTIAFNGSHDCGHRYRDLGKPWPSPTAEGVEAVSNPISAGEPYPSGAYLETRVCNGDCSADAFVVHRKFMMRDWDRVENGGYSCHCETDFKPYDLVVTAALIRLKQRMPEQIYVTSEGIERGFEDAKRLCLELFGWADNFELEAEESERV